MFDWKIATIEELARYILTKSRGNINTQIAYYKLKGNKEMLTKIEKARKLAKHYKASAVAEQTLRDYNGATNDADTTQTHD